MSPTRPPRPRPNAAGTDRDQPWDEHVQHVPAEFEQGSRRAQYRRRGAHEAEPRHAQEPRWPERPADGALGPDRPDASGSGPVGRQGYHLADNPGPPEAPRPGDRHAPTGGYDDYETEALYGTGYAQGDWPRTYRRAADGVGPDSDARGAAENAQGGRQENHRGKGPQGYRRSDQRLLEAVCERLTDDPYVDARSLSLAVEEGIVRIEGEVPARWVKHHLEHVAAHCLGVVDVDNRVRVVRSSDS